MNAIVRSWAASSLILAAIGVAAGGCGEEKKVSAVAADTSTEQGPKKPAVGGRLAAAVKAAESAQAAQPKGDDGPPERGIFAPGAADKVMPAGAAPKIDVLDAGAEPKVALAYAPPEGEQRVSLSVVMRQGGRGLPLEFTVALKVDKPKDEKPKGDKKDAPPGPVKVAGTIASVSLSMQAPKDLTEKIGKVKGTELRYQLAPNGVITNLAYTLPKGAEAGMEQIIQQLFEGVTMLNAPLPDKPVGVGGYWMVTDRLTTGNIEVVRYRVFRVEKIEKDKASLGVDIRQYAVKPDLEAEGGQKIPMEGFESKGKAHVDWAAPGLLPARGEGQVQLGAAVRVQGGQQATAMFDIQTKLSAAEPEKKK